METIEQLVSNVLPIVGFLIIFMSVVLLMSRILRREGGLGAPIMGMIFGGLLGLAPTFLFDVSKWLAGEVGAGLEGPSDEPKTSPSASTEPTPTPTPEPTPTQAPEPAAPPAPVPWEWIGAIAGIIVAVVLVGILIWFLISRGKVNLAERKKLVEARAKRQKSLNAKWADALATHATLDEKWASYEESLDSILANPLMRNLEDPAVAAAVRAMGRAQSLRADSAPHLGLNETISSSGASDYLDAVNEYRTAFEAAQRKSDLRGLDEFSKDDRDKIELARRMLAMAMDPGATESERQTSYDRVIKIVKGLRLSVPKKAFSRVELTAGVTSRGMLEAGV